MRKRTAVAAAALLALGPASASAMGPAEEMTQQMHEWTRYERPAFAPVEVQVDGATLTLLDATMESHPMEDETTIVRVTMGARHGENPAVVSRAVLHDRDGSSYPMAYVQ
ncbi:MAG: hypothetical protein ACE5KY_04805, partial [Candidatus Tectimicrobiota bacterium]